jgi:orotidine-5'-phosphate decarboxylase
MNRFVEMLEQRWAAGARVCVGLDSDPDKLPEPFVGDTDEVIEFNEEIIEHTKDIALAYKPNYAFYAGGSIDPYALEETITKGKRIAPEVPFILDAKRADIGNTNNGYVGEAFTFYEADAVTVNPYFGAEAMKPFLEQRDKGIIVLCRTSNPGGGEFQDVVLVAADPPNRSMPLYQYVAQRVARYWNYNGNCLLVVGATYPEELREVRKIVGDDMWLLLPGIGKQGADVEQAVRSGVNSRRSGIIINSSSGIIFASNGPDFAEAARRETLKLTEQINTALATIK